MSGVYRSGYRSGYRDGYSSGYSASAGSAGPPMAGLVLRLRADSNVNSSGLVTKLIDMSTATNDCTATGSARPTLVTNSLNGKSGLTMDGVANALSSSINVAITPGADRTTVVVAKWAGVVAIGSAFMYRSGEPDFYHLLGTSYCAGDGGSNITFAGSVPTTAQMFQWDRVSNNVQWSWNGTPVSVTGGPLAADSGAAGYTVGAIGGASFFGGILYEILAYDRVLAGSALAAAKTYVHSYYGLTIS